MPTTSIIHTLDEHGINSRFHHGKLQAAELYTINREGRTVWGRKWVNVEGWHKGKLFAWLGY